MLLCALITDVSISMGWYLIPLSSSVSSKEPTTYRASCLSATEHRHSKHQQIWRTDILICTCLFLMLQDIAGSSEEKVRNTHHALPFLKMKNCEVIWQLCILTQSKRNQTKNNFCYPVLSLLLYNMISVHKTNQNPSFHPTILTK